MPRQVGEYYHDIIFFERDPVDEGQFKTYTDELDFVLSEIRGNTQIDYHDAKGGRHYDSETSKWKSVIPAQDWYIAVSHYEYANGLRHPRPHVHVVYRNGNTNNTAGITGIIRRSLGNIENRKTCSSRPINKGERVKYPRCLRRYLLQGNGRVVQFEKLPVYSFCSEEERTGHFLLEEDDNNQHGEGENDEIEPFDSQWLWDNCQEKAVKRKTLSDWMRTNAAKRMKTESYDRDNASTTSAIDKGVNIQHGLASGKWLEQMFEFYLCSSQNQLTKALNIETDDKIQARWESIKFGRNADRLLRVAYDSAKDRLKNYNIITLASMFFERQDYYRQYFKQDRIMSVADSWYWLCQILEFNEMDFTEFFQACLLTMDMKIPKKGCLLLRGPPNAGKTMILESLARCALFYVNKSHFDNKSNFVYADLVGNRCALFNEPSITDETVNTMKNILEGCSTTVDMKYKSGASLEGMPILIATNVDLGMYVIKDRLTVQEAFDCRTTKYSLKRMNKLKDCIGKLHPGVWFVVAHYLCREGFASELDDYGMIDDKLKAKFDECTDALSVVYDKHPG